jgi:hypothetical protein
MKTILIQELVKVELRHVSALGKCLSKVLLARLGRTNHEEDLRDDSAAGLLVNGCNILGGVNVADLAKFLIKINDWL